MGASNISETNHCTRLKCHMSVPSQASCQVTCWSTRAVGMTFLCWLCWLGSYQPSKLMCWRLKCIGSFWSPTWRTIWHTAPGTKPKEWLVTSNHADGERTAVGVTAESWPSNTRQSLEINFSSCCQKLCNTQRQWQNNSWVESEGFTCASPVSRQIVDKHSTFCCVLLSVLDSCDACVCTYSAPERDSAQVTWMWNIPLKRTARII